MLIDDDPAAQAHETAQAIAQQFSDRTGKPAIDACVAFLLPSSAGTCNGSLVVTGAFRGTAVPSVLVFSLGVGRAPPDAYGPVTPRITWNINTASSGFATAFTAGGNATAAAAVSLSLRVAPIEALAPGDAYWLALHALLPDDNGATRFYWRSLAAGGSGAAPLESGVRDAQDVLGRGWRDWTALGVYESDAFTTEVAATSAHRLAARLEVTGCTGDTGASAPPPPPLAASPSGNGTGAVEVGGPEATLTTPLLIVVIVASALAFLGLIVAAVVLVRRWRRLKRLQHGVMGLREYDAVSAADADESLPHGAFLDFSPEGLAADKARGHAGGATDADRSHSEGGMVSLGSTEDVYVSDATAAQIAASRTAAAAAATGKKPWISGDAAFTQVPLDSGRGASARSKHLIDDSEGTAAALAAGARPARVSLSASSSALAHTSRLVRPDEARFQDLPNDDLDADAASEED